MDSGWHCFDTVTQPADPTTGVWYPDGRVHEWQYIDNVKDKDEGYASSNGYALGYFHTYGWKGLATLPVGIIPVGFETRLTGFTAPGFTCYISHHQMLYNGIVIATKFNGDSYSHPSFAGGTSSNPRTITVAGGASDMWGTSLKWAAINNYLGFSWRVRVYSWTSDFRIYLDSLEMKLYYLPNQMFLGF